MFPSFLNLYLLKNSFGLKNIKFIILYFPFYNLILLKIKLGKYDCKVN